MPPTRSGQRTAVTWSIHSSLSSARSRRTALESRRRRERERRRDDYEDKLEAGADGESARTFSVLRNEFAIVSGAGSAAEAENIKNSVASALNFGVLPHELQTLLLTLALATLTRPETQSPIDSHKLLALLAAQSNSSQTSITTSSASQTPHIPATPALHVSPPTIAALEAVLRGSESRGDLGDAGWSLDVIEDQKGTDRVLLTRFNAHGKIVPKSPGKLSASSTSVVHLSTVPSDTLASLTSLLSTPSALTRAVLEKDMGWGELSNMVARPSVVERCRAEKVVVAVRVIVVAKRRVSEGVRQGQRILLISNLTTVSISANSVHMVPRRSVVVKTALSELVREPDTCKYLHYELDDAEVEGSKGKVTRMPLTRLWPAQWVNCDVRSLDYRVLGKFSVIMADPPWDIHMSLPYGTMKDDEMRAMPLHHLQDDGFIFLWVTGRAMELGRECLQIWGYDRVEELIWVKTNQLQRLIRTGRTGHWLNHSKEHCLVGIKGNPKYNGGIDADVLVAEVRETSRKPDEVYNIVDRLAPFSRKVEIFGRMHNTRDGWVTLGNQLDGVRLYEKDVLSSASAATAAEPTASTSQSRTKPPKKTNAARKTDPVDSALKEVKDG
ncbi:hypothetical protein HDU93_005596, partial [Gonapodya sp. JEL0774]